MRDILTTFLKIGLTAYGGPAILGVMQADFFRNNCCSCDPASLDFPGRTVPWKARTRAAAYQFERS
jgi:hypothetical protein